MLFTDTFLSIDHEAGDQTTR